MIILFTGGGPADQEFHNLDTYTEDDEGTEVRVQTFEMAQEGKCAVYRLEEISKLNTGSLVAAGIYQYDQDTAQSLVDLAV